MDLYNKDELKIEVDKAKITIKELKRGIFINEVYLRIFEKELNKLPKEKFLTKVKNFIKKDA